MTRASILALFVGIGVIATACGSASPNSASPTPLAAATAAVPTVTAAAPPTSTTVTSATAAAPTGTAPVVSSTAGKLTLQVVSDGSDASYQVTEQLAQRNLPSDAIGTTKKVTGALVLDPSGAVEPASSRIVVDLASLQSDRSQRDGYIKRSTLETDKFPTAEFHPTSVSGLPSPLPTSGTVAFKMAGNLTVHGTTKPVVWDVSATVNGHDITGQAKTSFTWDQFGIEKPHVGAVLSVDDTIKLQVNLHLSAET